MDLPEFALSIRQPWAWAIVYAGKDIENRTWPTNSAPRWKPLSGNSGRNRRSGLMENLRHDFESIPDGAAVTLFPADTNPLHRQPVCGAGPIPG